RETESEVLAELQIAAYQRVAAQHGRNLQLGEDLALGLSFYLAKTKEQALKEIRPLYEEHVKMFAPLGFVPGLTPEQMAAVARRGGWDAAGGPTGGAHMKLGSWVAGRPGPLGAPLQGFQECYPR